MEFKPKTFAQQWRLAMMGLTAGAGIVATLLFVGIICIIWLGEWTAAVEGLRVDVLAKGAIGMAALMGASMVGILIAGPLSKVSAKFGQAEVSAEGDSDE